MFVRNSYHCSNLLATSKAYPRSSHRRYSDSSRGKYLIQIVQTTLTDFKTSNNCASQIIVRGNDGTWQYSGQGSGEGKQAHISSAYEELSSRFGTSTTATADPTSDNPSPQVTSVTRASTLLIDDDVKNIRAALKHSEFFFNDFLFSRQLTQYFSFFFFFFFFFFRCRFIVGNGISILLWEIKNVWIETPAVLFNPFEHESEFVRSLLALGRAPL